MIDNVLIVCDYIPHHNWATFVSWYSINKFFPDANYYIYCNKKPNNYQFFNWARTCKIKMNFHQPLTKENQIKMVLENKILNTPLLVVEPEHIMVRELYETKINKSGKVVVGIKNEEGLCSKAKDAEITPFLDYSEWGQFMLSDWINSLKIPFNLGYEHGIMGFNEKKIAEIWRKLDFLFSAVN